jgi:hypothetical protein
VYRKPSFFFKENSGFFSLALFCFIKRRYMLYATIKAPLQFLNLKPTASMTPPNLQTAQLASTALTFCHDDISLWASWHSWEFHQLFLPSFHNVLTCRITYVCIV